MSPVVTGRSDARRLCESCRVRIKVGTPRESEVWTSRLLLTEEQVDLILLAAGEFDRLCEEAGEYAEAVAFVDWLRPDALRETYESPARVTPGPPVAPSRNRAA